MQIRRRGGVFYVVFKCSARNCNNTWKSSYFSTKEDAERYIQGINDKPRCLLHSKTAMSKWLTNRGNRPRSLSKENNDVDPSIIRFK